MLSSWGGGGGSGWGGGGLGSISIDGGGPFSWGDLGGSGLFGGSDTNVPCPNYNCAGVKDIKGNDLIGWVYRPFVTLSMLCQGPEGSDPTANCNVTYPQGWGQGVVGQLDPFLAGLDLGIIDSGQQTQTPAPPKVSAQPTVKFRPPSWNNFVHQFLPCYQAQLFNNLYNNADVTFGTIALLVMKPKLGGPVAVVWVGTSAFNAGASCAFTSRAVYE